MGVGAGLSMYVVVVQKFTFAISSPDEFLLLSPNGWMNQDGIWRGGGPWSKPHCARWGPSSPPQKGAEPPIFGPFLLPSAHFCCHQTAGCIKMPLGMEVGLSPGDFVLDGASFPSPKGAQSPQFSANVRCWQTTG